MDDTQYIEREIDSFTYPVKLPKREKSLLASKVVHIRREDHDDKARIRQELSEVSTQKLVPFVELPRRVKAKARELLKIAKRKQTASDALRAEGVVMNEGGTHSWVRAADAEVTKRKEDLNTALAAVNSRTIADIGEVRSIAIDLANVHLKALEAKIRKADASIADRLEGLTRTQKALPVATVVNAEEE